MTFFLNHPVPDIATLRGILSNYEFSHLQQMTVNCTSLPRPQKNVPKMAPHTPHCPSDLQLTLALEPGEEVEDPSVGRTLVVHILTVICLVGARDTYGFPRVCSPPLLSFLFLGPRIQNRQLCLPIPPKRKDA